MGEERITYLAQTDSRNKRIPFGIKSKDRSRHVYVIGKTGMGKSTLLENMAVQDIRSGEGLAFIDPHGASAEKLLDYIPEERIEDVLYFAPFDMEYPISFNIMEDVGADKRHLVVNGLMSAFEKIWEDAWSARMAYILQNTLMALLEYPDSTLLGVNRMYTDKAYRKKVVDNITDPSVKAFWVDEFAKYTDRYTQEATPAIQNKIGQFASNPLIRNIIGQPKSGFDLRQIMDNKKIVIINLSKGKVGEGTANLLGSMLVTKLYLAAMSRADVTGSEMNQLPNFYLFVDEFQSFANKSFADILSEARKYKLNLTIAHQYIEQMEEEVRAAVFGNVGTIVSFRVGAFDAEILEKEFAPVFFSQDMVNLGFAQIYLKLMIDGISSQPFSATTLPPLEMPAVSHRDAVIEHSRKAFGKPRAVVEKAILQWHEPVEEVKSGKDTREKENQNRQRPQEDKRPVQAQAHGERQIQRDDHKHIPRQQVQQQQQAVPQKQATPQQAVSPASQVRQARQAAPSEILKQKAIAYDAKRNKENKGPSEASKNELREALSFVLKEHDAKKTENEEKVARAESPRVEKKSEHSEAHQQEKDKPKTSGEVPEKVLKNILEVEEKQTNQS